MGPIEDTNGDLMYDDSLTAHRFNDYFASAFTEEDLDDLPNVQGMFNGEPEEMQNDIEINETKVMNKLTLLNPTKAPGDDGIIWNRTNSTEESSGRINISNHQVVQKINEKSEVQEDWVISNVVPIFKKDEKCEVENYRPCKSDITAKQSTGINYQR